MQGISRSDRSETADDHAPGPVISVEGLRRAYGDTVALRDITVEVAKGRTLCVLGPNGAGKTTLLRVLAGLLRPTAGRVSVLGGTLPRDSWSVKGRVGYLGHTPLLYRELTVRENLSFHARLFGIPDGGADRIAELLESAHLDRRAGDRVRTLSAGMVQRLAVCRAVLHSPELLLLDEPLAHVDPDAADALTALIGAAPGLTRVLVTHDVEAGLAAADQVLALAPDGSVAARGPAEAFSSEQLRSVYGAGFSGSTFEEDGRISAAVSQARSGWRTSPPRPERTAAQ